MRASDWNSLTVKGWDGSTRSMRWCRTWACSAAVGVAVPAQPAQAQPAQLGRVLQLGRVDRQVLEHGLVVEEQPDGVEVVVLEPLHVPGDVVLVEPERRAGTTL